MTDLELACGCGSLRGVLRGAPAAFVYRVICHCSDCRAFAERLGHGELLDAHGGTDILQLSPARLAFTAGRDRLACLRLTERGPLRWYASCCGMPLANTPATAQLPFAGLLRAVIRADEAALRPVDHLVMTAECLGGVPAGQPQHAGFPPRLFARLAPRMLLWRLRGDHARSPFFEARSGAPVAAPATD